MQNAGLGFLLCAFCLLLSCLRSFRERHCVQIEILLALLQQLRVRTFLDDAAFVNDENFVRTRDCGQAMRDDERRAVFE